MWELWKISFLRIVGKLLADMILQRLNSLARRVYPDSQQGYREGRGTIDGIFTVRQVMRKAGNNIEICTSLL